MPSFDPWAQLRRIYKVHRIDHKRTTSVLHEQHADGLTLIVQLVRVHIHAGHYFSEREARKSESPVQFRRIRSHLDQYRIAIVPTPVAVCARTVARPAIYIEYLHNRPITNTIPCA